MIFNWIHFHLGKKTKNLNGSGTLSLDPTNQSELCVVEDCDKVSLNSNKNCSSYWPETKMFENKMGKLRSLFVKFADYRNWPRLCVFEGCDQVSINADKNSLSYWAETKMFKIKRGNNSGVYSTNWLIIELDRPYVSLKTVTKSR